MKPTENKAKQGKGDLNSVVMERMKVDEETPAVGRGQACELRTCPEFGFCEGGRVEDVTQSAKGGCGYSA